ncbi:MAG: Fic family protein [Nitrospirae bacterium]|nr:Fic family protein [Nitrospirota bacterium]
MKTGGRYDTSGLAEARSEPGSRGRVLRNRLGITRKREMDAAEYNAYNAAIVSLLKSYGPEHRFTASDIQKMHRLWLGGIYEWSGEYRQVNVSKGGFFFAASGQIPLLMAEFEKGPLSRHTPCAFKDMPRVIEALAEVHVELLLIHPFREGNGRLARLLSVLMGTQAGLPLLDFSCIRGKKKEEYFAAVRVGLDRDYKPMERIFELVIDTALKASC